MKRAVRFLSALMISLMVYAIGGEGACFADMSFAGQPAVASHDSSGAPEVPADSDACIHGHHHADPLPSIAATQSPHAIESDPGTFCEPRMTPQDMRASLERPPRI